MNPTIDQYSEKRNAFLGDTSICEPNRKLFRRFFEYQEYKLRRTNNLVALDAGCIRTLFGYLQRIRNANNWFGNKPFIEITESDMRRVYDGLEDGTIVTNRGERFKDRSSYYSKIFKSKLFEMAGKSELAKQVIEFGTPAESCVRYVLEDDVRKIAAFAFSQEHRLLLWLAFDIGENINSILKLVKEDFTRQINPTTNEPEYRIQLRRSILKRSRTARSELTLYRETVTMLDEYLVTMGPGDSLFKLGYRAAANFLDRAADAANVKCHPINTKITWKDLRSGMACDLLRKGWTRDEINARLGHKPSSKEIDKYINFFALDRHQPKAKVHQFEVAKLEEQLAQTRSRERLTAQQIASMQGELEFLRSRFRDIASVLQRNPMLEDVELVLAIKAKTSESSLAESVTACR